MHDFSAKKNSIFDIWYNSYPLYIDYTFFIQYLGMSFVYFIIDFLYAIFSKIEKCITIKDIIFHLYYLY